MILIRNRSGQEKLRGTVAGEKQRNQDRLLGQSVQNAGYINYAQVGCYPGFVWHKC
jgi:hypothetical protein